MSVRNFVEKLLLLLIDQYEIWRWNVIRVSAVVGMAMLRSEGRQAIILRPDRVEPSTLNLITMAS